MNKRAQASLEYLLTYGLALFVLVSAIAALTMNRPDIQVPATCEVSAPFSCLEFAKQTDTLRLLLNPQGSEPVTVGNMTFEYRGSEGSPCELSVEGVGTVNNETLVVGPDQNFRADCGLGLVAPTSFLEESEEMRVTFDYVRQDRSFVKKAEIELIT
jgi:hypothetical protein